MSLLLPATSESNSFIQLSEDEQVVKVFSFVHHAVRGLCIAMGQHSSLCGCAQGLILGGFDIVEVDVHDRGQVVSGAQEEARETEEEDKTRTNNARSNM